MPEIANNGVFDRQEARKRLRRTHKHSPSDGTPTGGLAERQAPRQRRRARSSAHRRHIGRAPASSGI